MTNTYTQRLERNIIELNRALFFALGNDTATYEQCLERSLNDLNHALDYVMESKANNISVEPLNRPHITFSLN